ncbi:unnamed protein product, partial [Allacma fusca]
MRCKGGIQYRKQTQAEARNTAIINSIELPNISDFARICTH